MSSKCQHSKSVAKIELKPGEALLASAEKGVGIVRKVNPQDDVQRNLFSPLALVAFSPEEALSSNKCLKSVCVVQMVRVLIEKLANRNGDIGVADPYNHMISQKKKTKGESSGGKRIFSQPGSREQVQKEGIDDEKLDNKDAPEDKKPSSSKMNE